MNNSLMIALVCALRKNLRLLLPVALLCTILLFGCTSEQTSITTAPSNAAQHQPPVQSAPSQPAAPGAPAYASLAAMLESPQSWSAAYSITDTGMPDLTQISQYVQNSSIVRIDMKAQNYQVRTYLMGKDAYSCTDNGKGWFCNPINRALYESEPIPSDLLYRLGSDLSAQPSAYSVSSDGSMIVAGISADCYLLAGSNATIRYCVSATGIPLYMKYDSAGNAKPLHSLISAKSFGLASDSDFALPANLTGAKAG